MSGSPSRGESNARLVVIPGIVFCVLSPLIVGVRFWSRMRVQGSLGWDDWTILCSLVFSMAVSIFLLAACSFGFGRHMKEISVINSMMALKLFYCAQIVYKININMTKASILLLYLRIFVQKPFRIICMIMIAIIVSYGIASTSASVFQCTPIPRAWNKTILGTCINITQNWFANAGFSIATDVIILCLPMPLIYALKLPRNQKIALMLVFALGGFVVVTSILRMTTLSLSGTSPDTTYQVESTLWTIVEENVGIICACLPMFRPFLSIIMPRFFPKRSHNASGGGEKLSDGSSGRGGWTPPMPNRSKNIQLTSVVKGNNNSAEMIIHGMPDSPALSDDTITKVTHFSVKYGSGGSDASL